VIADHLRGATFLAVDGVTPSNKEQGYVMRRLIRRAMVKAHDLGIEQNFLQEIVPVIADLYHNDFPEVAENRQKIIEILAKEEKAFRQTLRKGLREFEKLVMMHEPSNSTPILTGFVAFKLYDTYGFPYEISIEEANKRNVKFSPEIENDFKISMQSQRERSQTATKGTFKGGLADHSDETKKLHTATHLMYEALRQVLGDQVVQRGSNVTAERTRFDFSNDGKVTREQLNEVEKIVNEQIEKDLTVSFDEYPTDEAFKMGAKGAFGDKYGDIVKVYTMKADNEEPFSVEICGGPHVYHTGQLAEGGKHFKITKEEASSAGVRRIKAVLTTN
ncbi:MAG: alanine--tRNA ligase-related protein, partial [Candidatus Saccharibacteria bacterium]|nr:alanine--tRNA ligase-related protein [Candidatus Saccharibacteria bacterium]